MDEKSKKIKLILINGRAMIFNSSDYMKLRTEHRIIGKLIGIAVPYARNVNLFNLPACFSEYETRLMIEENIADLEDKKCLNEPPTNEMKVNFDQYQESLIDEIQKSYIESKLENVKINMKKILKGKREKLLKSGLPDDGMFDFTFAYNK